jgi:hypothetical protein
MLGWAFCKVTQRPELSNSRGENAVHTRPTVRVWGRRALNSLQTKAKKKGLWSPGEDSKLTEYIMKNGLMGCWSYVAKQAGKHHVYSHFNHFIFPLLLYSIPCISIIRLLHSYRSKEMWKELQAEMD